MFSPRLLVHSAAAGTLCALLFCAAPSPTPSASSGAEGATFSVSTEYPLYEVPSSLDYAVVVHRPESIDYTVRPHRSVRVYRGEETYRARRQAELEARNRAAERSRLLLEQELAERRQEICRLQRERAMERARQRVGQSVDEARHHSR